MPGRHAIKWMTLYVATVAAPVVLTLAGGLPVRRPWLVEVGVGAGFVALAMMCVQFLLTGRFYQLGRPFGLDRILHFHRVFGIISVGLVVAHVGVLLWARPAYVAFFDPRVNAPRAVALVLVLLAMGALLVLSLQRRRLGLSYEWWRLTHGALAALVVVIGLGHVMMVGRYVSTPLRQGVWIAGVGTALGLLGYIRVVKPWLMRRRPWRVVEVTPDCNESWSLTFEAEGHEGMLFEAGEYAWLTLGETPFSLQQHPFSFSSSAAETKRVRFTIRELGDFTGRIGETPIGQRAYLEGPYGQFHAPAEGPTVMIAGGIGITPFVSMLHTAADAGSSQRFYLFYGVPTLDRAILGGELDELQERLPGLKVVYVVDRPPADWEGERGYVTEHVLERHLPGEQLRQMTYMVCGPDAMIDAVHTALRNLGVPPHRQHSERFNIV